MSRSVKQRFFVGIYSDVNGDGIIDLGDAILALQVLVGLTPGVDLAVDINGNGKLDLAEAIYILQALALLR